MRVCKHRRIILTKSSRRTFSQHFPFQSANSNTRVRCERCSRLTQKTLARRKSIVVVHLLGLNKFYTLSALWPFFEKHVNVQCGIGSISMLISSYIHNAANRAIARNSCQRYFDKLEVLFSRKQQGAIRTDWKIYSCIFYHLCIIVTIFQVASSLSIFSTTIPFLAQYRKQMKSNCIFTYANWNINLIIGF